jgi:hypothetical protein
MARGNVYAPGSVSRKEVDLTLLFATDNDLISTTIRICGTMLDATFDVPVLDGATTATLILLDENGKSVYNSGACAANTSHSLTIGKSFAGELTVQHTTSGGQTANRAFGLAIYYA